MLRSLLASSTTHYVVITTLAVALAAAGVTEGVDSIVWYVFGIVDPIGADPISLLKPVYNPPPMFTHAYRPLSTALVKLGSWVFGRDMAGLKMLTFAHGLLLVPYGFGARRFLIVHGFDRRLAFLCGLTAMATPTILFSAWTIPEFDMLGGAIVLFAASEVHLGRLKRAAPLLALAILTKETTAIMMLAYLMAHVAFHWHERRSWKLLGAYSIALLAAVSPILLVRPDVTTEFNVADEHFQWARIAYLMAHNASQVFYILGPVGALLLLVGAPIPRRHIVLGAGIAVLFGLTPLLRHYNHYESVVFSHWMWVALWTIATAVGLTWTAIRGDGPARTLSLAIGLGFCGLLAGPILASFSRADLSARLYAPLLPMMHALALRAAHELWQRGGLQRVASGVLVACFLWMPAAGAINAWQFNQARFPVEVAGKRDLLAALKPPCPVRVFYTNRDQELAQEELGPLGGVPHDVAACAQLIQLAVTHTGPGSIWDYPKRLEGYDQDREQVDTELLEDRLRDRQALTAPLHVYIQHARSEMNAEANAALNADFGWATDRMPEVSVGYLDQTVGIIYVPDTPLERLFEDAAPYKKRRSVAFFQLPVWLQELPRRAVSGVPILETYRYRATLYSIPFGVKPTGTPAPRYSPPPPGDPRPGLNPRLPQ